MGQAITILCTIAAGIAILLRIYSTFLARSRVRVEDVLGAIATVRPSVDQAGTTHAYLQALRVISSASCTSATASPG
jgi:hypothetical protein